MRGRNVHNLYFTTTGCCTGDGVLGSKSVLQPDLGLQELYHISIGTLHVLLTLSW